jgi:hypothetical protein
MELTTTYNIYVKTYATVDHTYIEELHTYVQCSNIKYFDTNMLYSILFFSVVFRRVHVIFDQDSCSIPSTT